MAAGFVAEADETNTMSGGAGDDLFVDGNVATYVMAGGPGNDDLLESDGADDRAGDNGGTIWMD